MSLNENLNVLGNIQKSTKIFSVSIEKKFIKIHEDGD